MPILVFRLSETDGTKARKSESSIEVSKMLGLVCLGYGSDILEAVHITTLDEPSPLCLNPL